jgi:peroxiredoxin Q/BCP
MLQVGQPAPDFTLTNQDGQTVTLSSLRGKRVVLFAFPKAFTAGCDAQACTFRDELPQISATNALVFGVSADSPATLKKWKDAKKLNYDLLSDSTHAMLEAYSAWGIALGSLIRIPIAATRSYWVIDENGILVDQQVGVGPGESVQKALAAVQRLGAVPA